jgi:hypothetical protein
VPHMFPGPLRDLADSSSERHQFEVIFSQDNETFTVADNVAGNGLDGFVSLWDMSFVELFVVDLRRYLSYALTCAGAFERRTGTRLSASGCWSRTCRMADSYALLPMVTSGNLRRLTLLLTQIERVLSLNDAQFVSLEIVEAARDSLVIEQACSKVGSSCDPATAS